MRRHLPFLPRSHLAHLHLSQSVSQTQRHLSQLGRVRGAQRIGYSECSIWVANCPSQPPNSVPAPISAPEHMVLLAPLAPIHFLFKTEFQFQPKNIRSRKIEEQRTKLQICFLLLQPISARLFLPMEGHHIAGHQGDRMTLLSIQG